jgi:UDP-N-acetyl-D-glucosamine dehydrogenase
VLESTTYPGTTRDVLLPILETSGLSCGEEFFLAYAPEREDPGRRDLTTAQIPRLVGGIDDVSAELARALYGAAVETVISCSSAEVAEAAKLLENIYRAVNIAMVNEMKTLMVAMDIDIHEVIDAAATKPFGFSAFRPGPGLGGHCLPIDPFYLAHKARAMGMPTRFIELAGEVNRAMPKYVVERTCMALLRRMVEVSGARVLVLGLAYKANVDDVRESPSFVIIEELLALGATVDYHDPWVPKTHPVRHATIPPMASVALDGTTLPLYDVVVVATDHAAVDYGLVAAKARLVIDTRGVMVGRDVAGEVETA